MTTNEKQVSQSKVEQPEVVTNQDDRPVFTPPTDIYAREDGFVLLADLPGVDRDSIEVNLEDNLLSIRGRTQRDEHPGHELLYRSYTDGVFERSFTLSAEIDSNRIKAQLKDGVLRLVLPKLEKVQPKTIPVQVEG